MARRLNKSHVSAMLQSNLITIYFGTTEARPLNWAFSVATVLDYISINYCFFGVHVPYKAIILNFPSIKKEFYMSEKWLKVSRLL